MDDQPEEHDALVEEVNNKKLFKSSDGIERVYMQAMLRPALLD